MKWFSHRGPLPLQVTFLSILILFTASIIPLEINTRIPMGPLVFMGKMTIFYIGMLVPVFGWGLIIRSLLHKVSYRFCNFLGASETPCGDSVEEQALYLWATALAGMVALGLVVFLGGLYDGPSTTMAFIALIPGYLCILSTKAIRYPDPQQWLSSLLRKVSTLGRNEKGILAVFLFILLFRSLSVFDFQNHEDSYLYHLSLSDSWILHGHTGVLLLNIFSGYSLAVEHFYLLLKLIFVGNAEQNALAQMFHLSLGYGLFFWSLMALARRWMPAAWRMILGILLLQPTFLSYSLLPKNDGFLAAVTVLGFVSLANRRFTLFLMAAAMAFIIKATAAFSFLSAGIVVFIASILQGRKRDFINNLVFLLLGAFLMVLFWSPFAARSFLLTGNPLFPLVNEFFNSPFAPSSISQVVAEMRPLSLTPKQFLESIVELLKTEETFIIALVAMLIGLSTKSWRSKIVLYFRDFQVVLTLTFVIVAFWIVQLGTGEYTVSFSSRHFLVGLGPLLVVSLAILFQVAKALSKHKLILVVMVLLSVGTSNIDVSLKNAARSITTSNLTQSFLERKPLMKIYNQLDRQRQEHGEQPFKVLALTDSNVSYFLPHGDVWHATKTFPLWTWDIEAFTQAEWRSKLAAHNIELVVIQDQYRKKYASLISLPHGILLREGEYSLLQMGSLIL